MIAPQGLGLGEAVKIKGNAPKEASSQKGQFPMFFSKSITHRYQFIGLKSCAHFPRVVIDVCCILKTRKIPKYSLQYNDNYYEKQFDRNNI